jgi:hypothetical protein
VAGDVADRQAELVAVDGEGVVPVAADLGPFIHRAVDGDQLDPGVARQGLGEHRPLEGVDHLVAGVELVLDLVDVLDPPLALVGQEHGEHPAEHDRRPPPGQLGGLQGVGQADAQRGDDRDDRHRRGRQGARQGGREQRGQDEEADGDVGLLAEQVDGQQEDDDRGAGRDAEGRAPWGDVVRVRHRGGGPRGGPGPVWRIRSAVRPGRRHRPGRGRALSLRCRSGLG